MKEIELHSKLYPGKVALVDDEDYELVSAYRWYPHKTYCNTFYAEITARGHLSMHQLITGYAQTDHKDHNGLNNQRDNLRDATHPTNNEIGAL